MKSITPRNKLLEKMQFKLLIVCSFIGLAIAQRGHYAGNSRPILGERYSGQSAGTPAQSNFAAPSQGSSNVRFDDKKNDNTDQVFHQQQPSLGSGFNKPVEVQQGFPFAPFNSGFNGR